MVVYSRKGVEVRLLFIAEKLVKQSSRILSRIKETIEKTKAGEKVNADQAVIAGNISSIVTDVAMFLRQLDYCERENSTAKLFERIILSVKQEQDDLRKKEEKELLDYLSIVEQLIALIDSIAASNLYEINEYSLTINNFNRVWGYGRFVFPPEILERIALRINKKEEFNLLDMNCENGENLLFLKNKMPYINSFGISYYPELQISKEDRNKIKRLILGGINNLTISNDCFDVVIAAPRITLVSYDDLKHFVPTEEKYLEKAFNYLRKDGLLIYATPICTISKNVATFLAKNFKDVSIIHDDKLIPGVVVILGTKKSAWDRELDAEEFVFLRNLVFSQESLDDQEEKIYTLPDNVVEVRRFRGGTLDNGEMNLLFSMSSIMKEFWKKQRVEKISDRAKRPLLPFSVGQLGLVLTSGCLDGVIEEPGGCSHVVKGRVVKVIDTEREFSDSGDRIEVSSTTSNRVEISMFLPDGTFRSLI